MASVAFEIPAAPSGWTPPQAGPSKISAPKARALLPVGPAYYAYARRKVHNVTFDQEEQEAADKAKAAAAEAAENIEDDLGVGDEEESLELLARDAKDWKNQDHYAVLGLSKFRYKANIDQIRIAHRKKVLKHHPDKKANSGDSDNDNFFKCIQKALEILSNPERRRQFDSVDPWYQRFEDDFDAAELQKKTAKDSDAFFRKFGPIFEREARFSKQQPVPLLGPIDASKADVEGFYDFWYNFDSWRSFEYLDKEVNEGSDSRDDKRYTEKKNKSDRARRKKDDNTRVRTLVDLALGLDPRIRRIKQEEKEERERKKNKGKPTPAQQKAEEERLRKEAEEQAKAAAEADAAAKAEAKKAKAAAANAAKKARRAERAATGAD
ncbi:DnaJ-domain-containing protein [Clavulina sp. PMI_390]|nr:DnaJ-domain-containing protein [Clavulina sp. PMI_390]